MALASIFSTNLFDFEPDGVIAFHESSAAVRESFSKASEWTGIPVDTLLHQKGFDEEGERLRALTVALAAAQFGVHDELARKGLKPHLVGGLSLGGLVSSAVAGSLGRREIMDLLMRGDHTARRFEGEPAQGVAAAYVPVDRDPGPYLRPEAEGVYLSSDFGPNVDGKYRIVLLAGYREALVKFAEEQPEGIVYPVDEVDVAVHTPLRERAESSGRQLIETISFQDPTLPLCSGLEPKTLTTGEEVRAMFADNFTHPVSMVHLTSHMAEQHGTRLGLVMIPSPAMKALKYPFPVVFLDSPEAVPQAMAAVFEHGVRLRRD